MTGTSPNPSLIPKLPPWSVALAMRSAMKIWWGRWKVAIDKSMRRTDWAQRPLSSQQIDYALSDVVHLRAVYDKLIARLKKTQRLHWLDEEMDAL